MNLIYRLLYYEGEEIRLARCQGCRLKADLLRYLDYVFEKAFLGMTQVKTKHTQGVPAVSLKLHSLRVCLSTAIQARLVTEFHIFSRSTVTLAMDFHPGL